MMPGSSMTSGRGETGGGGGGVEVRVCWCEGVDLLETSPPLNPLPVTSFGGAMATNLTTPLGRPLIRFSALSAVTPMRD